MKIFRVTFMICNFECSIIIHAKSKSAAINEALDKAANMVQNVLNIHILNCAKV